MRIILYILQLSQALIDEKKEMIMEHVMDCLESEKATDGKPFNDFHDFVILSYFFSSWLSCYEST